MCFMKYFIMTIWTALLLSMVGCSQEEIPSLSEESAEIVPVKISLGGDLIQTEESPLSRAETESRDLYGIQVYRGGDYFAYGMFDNTNDITINLLADGIYSFECTAIKDGKDVLDSYYTWPFRCYGALSDLGFFEYSWYHFEDLDTNSAGIGNYGRYCREINRYYGRLSNYTPSVNGVVNMELKRVSFGIKLKVTNLQEGTVSVTCKNDYNTFINKSGLTSDYESEGEVYSMANVYDAWQYAANDYTEPLILTVTWDREGGLISDTWTKTIQVKRNVMNTIRIKMGTDEKEDTGIGVTPEGGDEGEEEEEIPLG